jgi:hypothetical protein
MVQAVKKHSHGDSQLQEKEQVISDVSTSTSMQSKVEQTRHISNHRDYPEDSERSTEELAKEVRQCRQDQ